MRAPACPALAPPGPAAECHERSSAAAGCWGNAHSTALSCRWTFRGRRATLDAFLLRPRGILQGICLPRKVLTDPNAPWRPQNRRASVPRRRPRRPPAQRPPRRRRRAQRCTPPPARRAHRRPRRSWRRAGSASRAACPRRRPRRRRRGGKAAARRTEGPWPCGGRAAC